MTAVSGMAVGFFSLFMARVGVGVGEAGGSPPSQSLISDYFPPERRGFALGVLFMYIPLGFLVGFLVGGWVNEFFGWRAAFMVVGVPGVVLALILRLTLREPPRGHSENHRHRWRPPSVIFSAVPLCDTCRSPARFMVSARGELAYGCLLISSGYTV
jgi:MFS family permease